MKAIDSKTLELLRCPVTNSKLAPADHEVVDWINQQIGAGQLCDQSGAPVGSAIEGALVNDNKSLAMPIRCGVISLSTNRAISIEKFFAREA